jgi:NADH:ubiquinone oxidoreductase subunit 4 (subunit M)
MAQSSITRTAAPNQLVSLSGAFVVAALALLLIWFGVYPTPLLDLIRTTMEGLI